MPLKYTRRSVLTGGLVLAGASLSLGSLKHAHAITPGPTPIRLATRMTRGVNESPEETVKRIRESGYTSVNTQPSQWSEAELAEMRVALKKYDVTVFEVGAYSNIMHPDLTRRQEILANIVRKFEDAENIGCPMVATVSGCCDMKYLIDPHPDNWIQKSWNVLVASVRQILKDTAGMNVSLGMEAQVTTNIDGPKAHRRLIDDVGDERCGVNLDPVNMISLQLYHRTTELLDECFELLGEHILGCHAKDTYIWPDIQTLHIQEVCPGKGVMDYETYLANMSRMQWPRALFAEHLKAEEYPQAKAYIEEVANRIGVKIYE